MSRREFLLNVLLALGGLVSSVGVVTGIIKFIFPPGKTIGSAEERVKVAKVGEIGVGEAKNIVVGGKTGILINLESGYVAMSTKCTHLGCIVKWDGQAGVLRCPCHDGIFGTGGKVISGPPPAPLPVWRVQVVGEDLLVGMS